MLPFFGPSASIYCPGAAIIYPLFFICHDGNCNGMWFRTLLDREPYHSAQFPTVISMQDTGNRSGLMGRCVKVISVKHLTSSLNVPLPCI